MCGIAGALLPGHRTDDGMMEAVRRMTSALGHRGPDGQGVAWCTSEASSVDCRVAFGHTRLAIIDLTERGAQPMRNDTGSVWITFNGEIYNYRDLREQLRGRGLTFASDSDTEVILRGYEAWGDEVFERLNGMFALALWDGRDARLRLVRDRFGIKPLYVHRRNGVLFASEVRALLASARVPRRLDPIAVDQFLAYQTVPSPRTLVADVEMLPPGTIVHVDAAGRMSSRRYWDLLASAAARPAIVSHAEAAQSVGERLATSVRAHLVSDVPVGVFLSGGIDSSVLVSLVRQAGVTPRTFTVAFPGTSYDEAPFARAIAEAFDTEHSEVALDEAAVLDHIRCGVSSADHPTGDGLNTFVIARAVRAAGLKVALSGVGADELFGGYPSFQRFGAFADYARAWKYSPRSVRQAMSFAVRTMAPHTVGASKAAALLESDGSVSQAYPIMRQLFLPEQRNALLATDVREQAAHVEDPYVRMLTEALHEAPASGLMSRVSYAESRTYMHDLLLRDADQMSMRQALEVRVPFLDHRLAEYLMGLPDAVKQPGRTPKRLLRESLPVPLPAVCTDRPKRGFVLPFDEWMRTSLGPFCARHLGPEGLGGRRFMRPRAVDELWRTFLERGPATTWSRPWALVALNAWLEDTGVDL